MSRTWKHELVQLLEPGDALGLFHPLGLPITTTDCALSGSGAAILSGEHADGNGLAKGGGEGDGGAGWAVKTSLSAESVFQLTSTAALPAFLQVRVKVLAVAAPSVKVATLPVSAAVEAQV